MLLHANFIFLVPVTVPIYNKVEQYIMYKSRRIRPHRYVNYINVFDSSTCMSHNITVVSDGAFIRDLCFIRDHYTVFNNCAINTCTYALMA